MENEILVIRVRDYWARQIKLASHVRSSPEDRCTPIDRAIIRYGHACETWTRIFYAKNVTEEAPIIEEFKASQTFTEWLTTATATATAVTAVLNRASGVVE